MYVCIEVDFWGIGLCGIGTQTGPFNNYSDPIPAAQEPLDRATPEREFGMNSVVLSAHQISNRRSSCPDASVDSCATHPFHASCSYQISATGLNMLPIKSDIIPPTLQTVAPL